MARRPRDFPRPFSFRDTECRSPSAKRAPRKSDRDWIEETYGEYLADLTADTTGVFPSLTVTGQSVDRNHPGLVPRRPLHGVHRAARAGAGRLRGGAAQRSPAHCDEPKRHYRLSEFFIRKPFRNTRRRPRRGDADLRALRRRVDGRPSSRAIPRAIRFWRRVVSRVHQRQVPREARAGRDRAFVHERGTGVSAVR